MNDGDDVEINDSFNVGTTEGEIDGNTVSKEDAIKNGEREGIDVGKTDSTKDGNLNS